MKKNEREWSQAKRLSSVQFLILGHHGSLTSTSPQLLEKLPNLQMAIVSARKSRYGHPHGRVRLRLNQLGIPLLSTEAWGNIKIDL